MRETGIAESALGDFSNIVAERVFVPSLDGKVKIPLEIVHAKNAKRGGTDPKIMTAYGYTGSSRRRISARLFWLGSNGAAFARRR